MVRIKQKLFNADNAPSKIKRDPAAKKEKVTEGGVKEEKRAHRFRNGTVARREIPRYQRTGDRLTATLPFQRLVREIIQQYDPKTRFTQEALEALHEMSEAYMVKTYKKARVTKRISRQKGLSGEHITALDEIDEL